MTFFFFFAIKHFPDMKSTILYTIASATFPITVDSSGSLQIAINIFFSTLLSITIILFCIKIFPGYYLFIWRRAAQLFIHYIEQEIGRFLEKTPKNHFFEEIAHLNVMRYYCKLLPQHQLRPTIKMTVHFRNILLVIKVIDNDEKNSLFWHKANRCLHQLKLAIKEKSHCSLAEIPSNAQTILQKSFAQYLTSIFIHWNSLCNMNTCI